MASEWYRSAEYSAKAIGDFNARLHRSRPHSRAQYLRIKAVTLFELNKPDADEAAISLLHRIIEEHAGVWYEVNFAHEELGRAYERLGRLDDAEREYRWVVESYRRSRSGTSGVCELNLVELIIRTAQSGKYAEAADLLTRVAKSNSVTFKSDWFRYWLASARLADRIGRPRDAAEFAQRALTLAASQEPQFPRHPSIGRITIDPATIRELKNLSKAERAVP